MNGQEVLRMVDVIHREKGVDQEIVFEGIEQAILSAARKHYGEEEDIVVRIDRESGDISADMNGEPIPSDELGDLLGRIAAQTAKQVMIQKIREAERDSLYDEFNDLRTQIVSGTITRVDRGVATVNLGKVEAILPRSEQIPGEAHRVNERVRATVLEVRKQGSRVKIVLSRTHPELVRRLFEVEIPEVAERIIEVRSLAREAGYRSKVAVSCFDSSIDCVGACVGVRGSRIKNIVDELGGERIDIVRWNDSLQVLIPNALQPAEVEDVILCPMLGRVIVLVREDQLSLAIGKKGQNVRLASKLVGWDIEVMTQEELDEQLDRTVAAFSQVPHVSEELAENLVSQGFFSFEDLSVIEPDQLQELSGLSPEMCDEIVEYADREAEREEKEADERRRLERERASLERQMAAAGMTPEPGTAGGSQPADSAQESAALEAAATSDTPPVQSEPTAETDEGDLSGGGENQAPQEDVEEIVDSVLAETTETEVSAETTLEGVEEPREVENLAGENLDVESPEAEAVIDQPGEADTGVREPAPAAPETAAEQAAAEEATGEESAGEDAKQSAESAEGETSESTDGSVEEESPSASKAR